VSRVIDVARLLLGHWGMDAADVRSLGGGINSDTWLVRHEGATYVAKHVPADGIADLLAGCEVASTLADAGFATGRPVPTTGGSLVSVAHGLALLEHVPGRELDGETDEEQRWMAGTLAGVHLAGDPATRRPAEATDAFMSDWLSPPPPAVDAHPWLVRAVQSVRGETDPLTLTWSVLHTDPAPEAFVHDDDRAVTGLIDWAGSRRGPVLYDVASAVMYLGGRERAHAFLDAYRTNGPVGAAELQHLDAFSRFREVVQGVYFARRLAADDLTGGIDRADNAKGLEDARRRLAALGLDTTLH
jgi:Ser/Thr protein kinase RdoA (MazF antagonist)